MREQIEQSHSFILGFVWIRMESERKENRKKDY